MVILGLTMLLQTACGQVDMVLVTAGRSSWSLANGLLAVVVNVGLDVLLIPPTGSRARRSAGPLRLLSPTSCRSSSWL